jgi:hypothetical protein
VRRLSSILLALALALEACGCSNPSFGKPNWFHPGPAPYQQERAKKFDPYSEYGPALGESRPRSYDAPPPEASRGRLPDGGSTVYEAQ